MNNQQVAKYYALLGEALEDKYLEPDMDEDIDDMSIHLGTLLSGHTVLELGCGTGFWTEVVAESAQSVVAVDINASLVDIARERGMPEGKVTFRVADALDLPEDIGNEVGKFTAVLVSFLWSHLNKKEQEGLLATLKKRLGKDVLLVLLDDSFVEGFSETIAKTDADGTTYEILTLPSGERFEVPKSYQSDSALRKRLGNVARDIRIERVEFFWILTCKLK